MSQTKLQESGVNKKQCQMCNKTKTVDNFHKSKSSKDGFSSYCSTCKVEANRRSNAKRLSEDREKFLNQRKDSNLRRTFGITLSDYNRKLSEQGGVCAICGGVDSDRMLAVDHNHATGQVRWLLCQRCNRGIGMFDDNANTVRLAAKYLDN